MRIDGEQVRTGTVVPRLRLNRGQLALLAVLVLLLVGLVGALVSAQNDARRHTDASTRTEASATNALYTMRESLNYSLAVQRYLLGAEPRRSAQIARALLAQRLSIVDETGVSAGAAAGSEYLAALRAVDDQVAKFPAGVAPLNQRPTLSSAATPAVDTLSSLARHLVDDKTAEFRAQSRAYDAQLVQTRLVELALLLLSLVVAGALVAWVAVSVRRNHVAASAALAAQEDELGRTQARLDRMAALDRGHARVLELIAERAALSEVFAATAEAVSEVAGGHATRVRWGSLEIVRPERAGDRSSAVGWSSRFGAGRDDDGPGEIAILAHPGLLDDAARTGAMRCRDLARLAVETDRAAQRLSFQARHDALTGLTTRHVLLGQLDEQLFIAGRGGVELAVLFCDLDGFRVVNDELGHGTGDALLIEAAARLLAEVRDIDIVARHGGDEFVVLCPMLTDPGQAVVLADRLRRVLSAPYLVDGRDAQVGVSIGVCYAEDPNVGSHELMRAADLAMRRAKLLGGAQVAVFDWSVERRHAAMNDIGRDLARGIGRGELHVLYQPVVGLDDERLTAVEALVRWDRPGDEMWLPDRFLPVAENDGTIVDLDRWVLRTALASLAAWRERGLAADAPMTVNVAVSDVLAPGFADDVLFMLDDLGLPATALVLELREHGLVDVAIEGSPLALLRSRGVRVCLDDFGTGTSSITALRELPVDVVKLDRSLAASLDGADPGQVALLESVLLLAAALRLDVVAEGVETVAERATLTDLGVVAGQGWLFGRPMTTDALQQWMLDRASTPSQVAEGWPLPVR